MKLQTSTVTGCGNAACLCAGPAVSQVTVTINGIALHLPGRRPDRDRLLEMVCCELLRQQAIRQGLLPPHAGPTAPEPADSERQVMQSLIDQATPQALPDEAACQRHFETHRQDYVHGQALHVRHILFAVTPEVNVHALLVQAERALLELSRPGVSVARFAQLAAEFSSCPSGAAGGDLGWIGPEDCDPQLASELFQQKHSRWGMGVHPRLIQTDRGFHILEVLGRRKGRALPYKDVRDRIAAELAERQRAASRCQFIRELARHATFEGLAFDDIGLPGPVATVVG